MRLVDIIDNFASKSVSFIGDHSFWFWGVTAVLLAICSIAIGTIANGFNLFFILGMLFASTIAGWIMLPIYLLPFGLIQLLCYCIRNPLDTLMGLLEIISIIILMSILFFPLILLFIGVADDG